MKRILLIFTFCFFGYNFNPVYSQANNWIISTDISPMSRSGNNRVLNNPSGLNLEWRNRVGFKLSEQTMMGLSASYRHYDLKEIEYRFPDIKSYPLQHQVNNQLFGIGAFLTQYFHITPRFHLQTTAYLQVDQGKGTYKFYFLPEPNSTLIFPTKLGEIKTYRERNIFTGLEFGASYFLTPIWVLHTNINLLQYEKFRNTIADQSTTPFEFTKSVEQDGSDFSFLTDRTIINLGVMVLLGK